MKRIVFLCAAALALAGCAHHRPAPAAPAAAPIITPDFSLVGRVEMVNTDGRFAVVSFTGTQPPALGRRLGVYRAGVKVGELRVTGPQQNFNTVADILDGDVRDRDEVKLE